MPMVEAPSPNHGPRPPGVAVDILLLHYTGMRTGAEALERLRDPASGVSAHYLIEEDGSVCRLVAEERRAWHAGVSYWAGETDINARSIGIELVNPGHEFGYRAFPSAQIEALIDLAHGVVARWPIPSHRVLGHSDVAPTRKEDPGELFDWRYLAVRGIGLWPDQPGAGDSPAQDTDEGKGLMQRYGYGWQDEDGFRAATVAFQRHFRPTRFDGDLDGETVLLLRAVCAMLP